MSIKQKLDLEITEKTKWRHTIEGVIESCNIKTVDSMGKDIAEIVIADKTGRIKMGIWSEDFDGNENPDFRLYKKGEEVTIFDCILKPGHNQGPNEIKGLHKTGTITVTGKPDKVPEPPEEEEETLDDAITKAKGKKVKKKETPESDTGIILDPVAIIEAIQKNTKLLETNEVLLEGILERMNENQAAVMKQVQLLIPAKTTKKKD